MTDESEPLSELAIKNLKAFGWRETDFTDRDWIAGRFRELGYHPSPPVLDFLSRYFCVPRWERVRGKRQQRYNWHLGLYAAQYECYPIWLQKLEEQIAARLCPIGSFYGGDLLLLMDEYGRFFNYGTDGSFRWWADSAIEFLELMGGWGLGLAVTPQHRWPGHPEDGTLVDYLDSVRSRAPWLVQRLRGADDSLIQQLREVAWHPLPPVYVEFLRSMGVYSAGATTYAGASDDVMTLIDWFREQREASEPAYRPVVGMLPISVSGYSDPLCLQLDDPRLPVYSGCSLEGQRLANSLLIHLRNMTDQFIEAHDEHGQLKRPGNNQ